MLRDQLPADCRAYWDSRPGVIEQGVIHIGRFERYLSAFRRFVLPAIHPKSRLEEALEAKSLDKQREFYDRAWDTLLWRVLFRVAFLSSTSLTFWALPRGFPARRIAGRGVSLPQTAQVRTDGDTCGKQLLPRVHGDGQLQKQSTVLPYRERLGVP